MNNSLREIAETIKKYNSFAIVPHISPDADALGSVFALKRVLEHMQKEVCVVVEEALPSYLSFLNGEAVLCEECGTPDVCMCIDCGDLGRVNKRTVILDSAKVSINIDHHYSNAGYAQLNYVNSDASSAGEICFELIGELGAELDVQTANCLYCAVCGDTGSFKYSNTTPKTLRIAAELLEKGADAPKITKAIFDTENFDVLKLKGEISSKAELYCDGKIGVAWVDKATIERYCVDSKNVDNIVDTARRIEGVELAISFKETDDGTKISLRSNEYIDVSKIAARFGGGGHIRASGVMLKGISLNEAKKTVIAEAIKAVEDSI